MMKKLKNIPAQNPFKVPENYFEEVNKKILAATAGNDNITEKHQFYNRFRTSLLVAASVTGFILISFAAVKLLSPGIKNTIVSEVLYDDDYDSYINEIDILSLEEQTASFEISDDGSDLDKNVIIDYLLEENIEITAIYEHL